MTLPPELSPERLAHLAAAKAPADEPAPTAAAGPPAPRPAGAGPPAPARSSGLRRIARKARTAAGVFRREGPGGVKRVLAGRAKGYLLPRAEPRLRHLIARVTPELALLDSRDLAGRGADQPVHATVADPVDLLVLKRSGEVQRMNQELLKGEVRALIHRVEDLGLAIAPGTGIEGAGARIAELREKVNAVERRVRLLDTQIHDDQAPGVGGPVPQQAPTEPGTGGPTSDLFDYVGFERRFRGDPSDILAMQSERYTQVLLDTGGPIVDIGCGRGELLEALAGHGAEVLGVDTDPGMIAEGRARGLTVHHEDALSFLRRTAPGSLGAVFSAHVVEHLPLNVLLEFIQLSASRLRPGGVFVAETPNPSSLIVLGNSYIMDPTHVWPLHPSLLAFLCEGAGFRSVELRFHSPATSYHLPAVEHPDHPDWAERIEAAFSKLNTVLFGPQEYSVIARTPPAPDTATG